MGRGRDGTEPTVSSTHPEPVRTHYGLAGPDTVSSDRILDVRARMLVQLLSGEFSSHLRNVYAACCAAALVEGNRLHSGDRIDFRDRVADGDKN